MFAGNSFALFALLLFPVIGLALFYRTNTATATSVVLLAGAMFLPVGAGFDLPAGLILDKESVPRLVALLGCMLVARRRLAAARPGRGLDALALLYIAASLATVLTNTDPIVAGAIFVPGLGMADFVAAATSTLINWWVPFFLGRALITNGRDLTRVLRAFAVAGLVYFVLILVEVRFSPQLHRWFYGVHPGPEAGFAMTVRWGGYRPMLFMWSGLSVALFSFACVSIAATLTKVRLRVLRLPGAAVTAALAAGLVLCKSLAAIIYGAICLPLSIFASVRAQSTAALVVAVLVFTYPAARAAGVVPESLLLELASAVSEDREGSLAMRLREEGAVLARAQERLAFGWGGWARSWVWDPETGTAGSTLDGLWILIFGSAGAVGYCAVFGLLTWPVILAWRPIRRIRSARDCRLLAGVSLCVAFIAADQIPNATISGYSIFLAGALAGATQGCLADDRRATRRARLAAVRSSPEAEPVDAESGAPIGRVPAF